MSLKLKIAQRNVEEGDLTSCRARVKEKGFTCELVADWNSFKTEEECGRVYNYAFSDIEGALSRFESDKLMLDTFNAAIKKIEVGSSDDGVQFSIHDGTFKVLVNLTTGFVQSGPVADYLMDNL